MVDQEPNWQPISSLPMIAEAIDGYIPASDDLYASLSEARSKPHVMDDATLDRVDQVYGEQRDDMWLYDEQLRRWSEGTLTEDEAHEIARLKTVLGEVKARIAEILAIAAELREGAIDRIMEKSDLELGLEALLGGRFGDRP
jgi:hypothetical protein